MNHKRAFTLIELLVVIAIIAILAAILFPVFAQAKKAAKGAASISNNKQINTASMMYETDYDDRAVVVGIIGEADSPFYLGAYLFKPWGYLMVPYMKNGDIFQDPLTSPERPEPGPPAWVTYTYRTQFGYAFTLHSPYDYVGGRWTYETTSQTAIANPAETVKFLGKKTRQKSKDWYYVGSAVWMASLVAPPICGSANTRTGVNPPSYCAPAVRWGVGGYYQGEIPSEEDGSLTGGVAIRKTGNTITSFSDGHVAAKSPSYIASGTNWTRTLPYTQMRMTDINKYMWDID